MNLLFLDFFALLVSVDLVPMWFLADFLSPLLSALSNLMFSFSFLGTSLLKAGTIYFFIKVGFTAVLLSLKGYIILLDFFLFVLGLTDSTVGLLLFFLLSFLGSYRCTYGWCDFMIVDLLLFPNPPRLLLGLSFLWDMFTSWSSSFSDYSDGGSSFFLALTAFLWRSVEIDLLEGNCFLSSTRVLVLFLGGSCALLVGGDLFSRTSECGERYCGRVMLRTGWWVWWVSRLSTTR